MSPTCQCAICQHFDRTDKMVWRCAAFPDGIPAGIIGNTVDHREPVDGDGGLRFTPLDMVPDGWHPMNRRVLGAAVGGELPRE